MRNLFGLILLISTTNSFAAECKDSDILQFKGKESAILGCQVYDAKQKSYALLLKDFGDGDDELAGITLQVFEKLDGTWTAKTTQTGLGIHLLPLKTDSGESDVTFMDYNKNGRMEMIFEIFNPPAVGHVYIYELSDSGSLVSLIKSPPETAHPGKTVLVEKTSVTIFKESDPAKSKSSQPKVILKW